MQLSRPDTLSNNLQISFNNRADIKISVIFSLILTLNIFFCIQPPKPELIIFSGLTSPFEETAEVIKGLGRFIDSLKTIADFISTVIDPGALILLIIVALLSTGLSFLGIPKGKFSFFCSLAVADMLWFTWIKSFYQSNELTNKIFILIKSNLLLILPFIVIYFFKTPTFSKKLMPKTISFLKSPFKKKKAPGYFAKDEIAKITESLQGSNALLQKYIINDILNHKNKEAIALSTDTIKEIKELKAILDKFEK